MPSSFSTFFLFFWKLGSIGKQVSLLKMATNYLLEETVYNFRMHAANMLSHAFLVLFSHNQRGSSDESA